MSLMTGKCSENLLQDRTPAFTVEAEHLESISLEGVNLGLLDGREVPVTLDSREVKEGCLFIGIRGEKRDGSEFALEALEKGASGVVVCSSVWNRVKGEAVKLSRTAVLAEDTTFFLGEIARKKGKELNFLKIGITGSAGKTTTKELTYSVLSEWRKGFRSPGNFNNLIGLPLTILSCRHEDAFLVAEMGTNIPGEIERLTEILSPHVGLITNVGVAHLEGLGTVEDVMKEKGKLFEGLGDGGIAVVNEDDPRVVSASEGIPARKVYYGMNGRDVAGKVVKTSESGMSVVLRYGDELVEVFLPVTGIQFYRALLAAAAIAYALEFPPEIISEGAGRFSPPEGRFRVEYLQGDVCLIDDSYNANPVSFEAGFETLKALFGDREKVLVMGDMLELGDAAADAHRDVGKMAASLEPCRVILAGEMAELIKEGLVSGGVDEQIVMVCGDSDEAAKRLLDMPLAGKVVFVKASRKVGLDKVVESLRMRPSCQGGGG